MSIKSLDGIVRAEHIVESEYLQTLFVAVPKTNYKEWEMSYDDMEELEYGVVPGSSEYVIIIIIIVIITSLHSHFLSKKDKQIFQKNIF